MNDMEDGNQKKDSGNGIIWGSTLIAVALLASSITYAAVAKQSPIQAVQANQSAAPQDQGSYAQPTGGFAAPSCGVQ